MKLNLEQFEGHTPGPWGSDIDVAQKLLRDGSELIACSAIYIGSGSGKGGEIATLNHRPDDGLDLIGDDAAEHAANAYLIAAAPALLAECQAQREQIAGLVGALGLFVALVENDTIRTTNEGREGLIVALTNANAILAKVQS